MARKPRVHFSGAFYHVIARGNKGAEVFRSAHDYNLYLRFLREYKSRYPFFLYAYALMPTHIHLLVETRETPLSKIMQSLQFRYTRNYNLHYQTWGHLFQGRYKAFLCEKDPYFLELSAYIHLNPARAGLVKEPVSYPWSSYKAYALEVSDDLLDQRVLLEHFSNSPSKARKAYARFVKARLEQGKREEFYKAKDQRFLGSQEFVEEVRKKKAQGEKFKYLLSIPEIVSVVVPALGIPKDIIYNESRNRKGAHARAVVAYLARGLAKNTFKSVAEHFSRDPVAISQGVKKLETAIRSDPRLGGKITLLGESLIQGRKRILI